MKYVRKHNKKYITSALSLAALLLDTSSSVTMAANQTKFTQMGQFKACIEGERKKERKKERKRERDRERQRKKERKKNDRKKM